MREHTTHESLAETTGGRTQSTKGVEILEVGDSGTTPEVALVEKLDGGLTAFASYAHDRKKVLLA
jgi:hypothetical protein